MHNRSICLLAMALLYLIIQAENEWLSPLRHSAEELIGKNKDHHWDAHGHQKTAEILYRFLQENQLLIAK